MIQKPSPPPKEENNEQTKQQLKDLEDKINKLTTKLETNINELEVQDPEFLLEMEQKKKAEEAKKMKKAILAKKLNTISGVKSAENIIDENRIFVALSLEKEYNAEEIENIKNQAKTMIVIDSPEIIKQFIVTDPDYVDKIKEVIQEMEDETVSKEVSEKLDELEKELTEKEMEKVRQSKLFQSTVTPEKLVQSIKESVQAVKDVGVIIYNNQVYVGVESSEEPKSKEATLMKQQVKDHVLKQAFYIKNVKVTDNLELYQRLKEMMKEKDIKKLEEEIKEIDYKILQGKD